MSDNENYLAIARAWNVGAGKAQPTTSSHEAYALAAQAWKQGGETMLPDVNANIKAIAKKWNLETPEPQKQLPGKVEAQITTSEALWHLAAAKLLTATEIRNPLTGNVIKKFDRSAAEAGEAWLTEKINLGLNNKGIDVPRERPTPEKLSKRIAEIEAQFGSLLGGRVANLPTPEQLLANIRLETTKQARILNQKDISPFEKPTREEEILAAQLELMVGHCSPRELMERLQDRVYAQAADIALANQQATLARIAPDFNQAYAKLKAERPKELYFAPWLTTEVMFPKSQQVIVEDTVWGMSPTQLLVQRVQVEATGDDKREIDLALINDPKSPQGVLSSQGTPPYADYLKKRFSRITLPVVGIDIGRFVQPYIDMFTGPELGGIVVLRQIQASFDPIVLAVPDAPTASRSISKIAQLNRDAEATHAIINKPLTEIDAELKEPIRPKMIRHMLPALALDQKLNRGSKGNIIYSQARAAIEDELAEVRRKYHQVQVDKAKYILDATRKDRSIAWETINSITSEKWARDEKVLTAREAKLEDQLIQVINST